MVGIGSRSAACKGSLSARGLHHFLWTYGTTVFDLLHSIFPLISCVAVTMETPASPASRPCRGPRGPLSWRLFDGSESLNCLIYLPPQLVSEQQESRPLLSPSIDDFLCETKCDGLSRPVTSNTAGTVQPRFPISDQPGARSTGAIWSQLSLERRELYQIRAVERFENSHLGFYMNETLITGPLTLHTYNGLSRLNARCSDSFIYLFIHHSRLTTQQPTRTSSNSVTKDKQIGSVNPPGSGVTSLSSMLCLMSRLMAACLRNFFSKNSFMKNRLRWIWVSETQIQAGCPKNITYHRCFYTSAEKLKWGDSRVRISLL